MLMRKGLLTRRQLLLLNVSPRIVATLANGDATRDTYQRKVFYDGKHFFVWYYDATSQQLKYTTSADGIMWTTPVAMTTFSAFPYYGGNVDLQYPALELMFMGSNGNYAYQYFFTINGTTLTYGLSNSISAATSQGGSIVVNLDGLFFLLYHRFAASISRVTLFEQGVTAVEDQSISYGGVSTGGCQLLPYKTSAPYDMFALAKDASNVLYYNVALESLAWGSTFAANPIATLTTSFSDFCGCSQAQNLGAPQVVHIVYIKSTGQLCYRNYQNGVLSAELVLVASGASYPVIAVDGLGNLYVFYVRNGAIKLMKYAGEAWGSEQPFYPQHSYNTPAYLSTNQIVQNGAICLVWMEGTGAPYSLYFASVKP